MSSKAVPARIDGVVARDAPLAVVFRRGPARHTEMLLWNLDTNEVTPGQWIGAKVYSESCDLSPDGRRLVAMLGDWSSHRQRRFGPEAGSGAYTTVCRPPYFTALAISIHGTTWWGGGFWPANDRLELFASLDKLQLKAKKPARVQITELQAGGDPFWKRLRRNGWRQKQERAYARFDPRDPAYHPQLADVRAHLDQWPDLTTERLDRLTYRPGRSSISILRQRGVRTRAFDGGQLRWTRAYSDTWEALDQEGRSRLSFRTEGTATQWLDLDHRGRVIYGDEGRLWAWSDFPNGAPKMVADLNPHVFRAVPPPAWALEW